MPPSAVPSKRNLASNWALFLDGAVPYFRQRATNVAQLLTFAAGEKLLTLGLTWLHSELLARVAWLNGFIDQVDAITVGIVFVAFALLALVELAVLGWKNATASGEEN